MTDKISDPNKLQQAFQKILPLVDNLADALRTVLLIALAVSIWVFIYCFKLQQFSLVTSLIVSGLTLIPSLILSRIWYALESLKDIPSVAEDMLDDVTDTAAQSWHAVKSGKKGAFNIWGQAKKLFEIRSLLNSADDVIGQYFSIGPLINPFYLFLSVLAFIGLFIVILAGIILAVISLV
ncbi:MAG: hypothetical protein GQ582_11660 [Methyloprofundus sp.]|nr:hypothetical protein [Methyloprofundus sp.]